MLRACVVGIAQMKSGELPRSHARLFYHQLDAAVRLCRECATRPGWGEAREAFLELAELMADERDEARELIDDSYHAMPTKNPLTLPVCEIRRVTPLRNGLIVAHGETSPLAFQGNPEPARHENARK